MRLLRSFSALSFALVLLSIAGLCAAQRSVTLLLVAGTLAALSWYITEGPRGRILPRWVSNILVLAASLFVFADFFEHRQDVMGVLGRFAIFLTLIKLYERRTARDHAHLLVLSLLLMMTGCMQSNDLLFGIVLLLYVILGLYVVLLFQLHASFESTREARQKAIPAGYRLVPPLKPVCGRQPGLHFRTLAAAIGALGVALSLAVFVAFPRDFGADLLGTLQAPSINRTTKFSTELNLIAGGFISDSRLRVMTVQLTDSQGRMIRDGHPLLLRGAVLDRYEGRGRWTMPGGGQSRSVEVSSAGFVALADGAIEPAATITQRIVLTRPASGISPLFSMYTPVLVSMDTPQRVLYDLRRQCVKTSEQARRVLGYSVRAQPEPTDLTLETLTGGAGPLRHGWFPDSTGAVRGLAQQVLREAGLPLRGGSEAEAGYSNDWAWNRRAAEAFTDFLHSDQFMYTTDLRSVVYGSDDADPIAWFLTQSRRGHCEYFASGLTALCHSVRIPARIAIGYVAYDFDEAAQQYNVLESNAHAWSEIAVGPQRWATFDPTPPAVLREIHSIAPTFADTLRTAYQSVEGDWSANFVGFDGTAQTQLVDRFNQGWARRFAGALEAVRDWMERVNMFFNVGPGGYIWMGIVACALVIAVVALVKLMRRSLAIRRVLQLQHMRGGQYQRMLRQLGFYLDMLSALKRGGMPKPDWQPPLQFAAAIAERTPEAGKLVREITATFYEARYGNRTLERTEIEQARRMVAQLAGTLKSASRRL